MAEETSFGSLGKYHQKSQNDDVEVSYFLYRQKFLPSRSLLCWCCLLHRYLPYTLSQVEEKRSKKSQWRRWKKPPSPTTKPNELSDGEVFQVIFVLSYGTMIKAIYYFPFLFLQLLVKNGMATESKSSEKDKRFCVLCYQSGDGDTNGTARYVLP